MTARLEALAASPDEPASEPGDVGAMTPKALAAAVAVARFLARRPPADAAALAAQMLAAAAHRPPAARALRALAARFAPFFFPPAVAAAAARVAAAAVQPPPPPRGRPQPPAPAAAAALGAVALALAPELPWDLCFPSPPPTPPPPLAPAWPREALAAACLAGALAAGGADARGAGALRGAPRAWAAAFGARLGFVAAMAPTAQLAFAGGDAGDEWGGAWRARGGAGGLPRWAQLCLAALWARAAPPDRAPLEPLLVCISVDTGVPHLAAAAAAEGRGAAAARAALAAFPAAAPLRVWMAWDAGQRLQGLARATPAGTPRDAAAGAGAEAGAADAARGCAWAAMLRGVFLPCQFGGDVGALLAEAFWAVARLGAAGAGAGAGAGTSLAVRVVLHRMALHDARHGGGGGDGSEDKSAEAAGGGRGGALWFPSLLLRAFAGADGAGPEGAEARRGLEEAVAWVPAVALVPTRAGLREAMAALCRVLAAGGAPRSARLVRKVAAALAAARVRAAAEGAEAQRLVEGVARAWGGAEGAEAQRFVAWGEARHGAIRYTGARATEGSRAPGSRVRRRRQRRLPPSPPPPLVLSGHAASLTPY